MYPQIAKIMAPQISFEGAEDLEKFADYFCKLYRIEIFKDGLDLILTKLQSKELSFEIKKIKGWDTNIGCFLTENSSFFDKTLGKFFHKKSPKIILRKLSYNVLAHEMAHALEYESGLNLGEDFRKAIGFDMKNREPSLLTLKAEKKRLMVEALKAYPQSQFLSELFARYFELLSISRNVCENGDFATKDVMEFFENTTNFVTKIFNPKIQSKIDKNIANFTKEIALNMVLKNEENHYQQKIESKQKQNQGLWTKGIKSNASWSNNKLNLK